MTADFAPDAALALRAEYGLPHPPQVPRTGCRQHMDSTTKCSRLHHTTSHVVNGAALTWPALTAALVARDGVQWDRERPIPLGVTEPWPLEVAE